MKRAILADFLDTTNVPAMADLLTPHGIDAAAFAEWLGAQLGYYHASEAARTSMPTLQDESQNLATLTATLQHARDAFGLDALPPRIGAESYAAALRMGVDWPGLRKRLNTDLNAAIGVFQIAADRLQAIDAKTGRPAKHARAELLRTIVDRLRTTPMKAEVARITAEHILTRCCVDVPLVKADTRGLRKAQRRGKKKVTIPRQSRGHSLCEPLEAAGRGR